MKQNKVAITGGIGSGKSTVCKILRQKGYAVFSCDEIYAELLENGALLTELVNAFGHEIIDKDGKLDRRELSRAVFSDGSKRELLNKITHEEIFKEAFRRAESENGIVFFEVPLLFEGNYQKLFDKVLVVLRNKSDRIKSVEERDGLSQVDVEKRINNQYNYENQDFAQYYVIHNNGNIIDLPDIIDNLLSELTV